MNVQRLSPLPRVVLALVATLFVTWFAVLWRDEHVGDEAADRVFNQPGMSPAEYRRALDEMRQAELLNPGEEWTTLRAAALVLRDKPAAARLARSVVRREPDNLEAWVVVLNASRGRDPRLYAEAATQVRRLSPPPRSNKTD